MKQSLSIFLKLLGEILFAAFIVWWVGWACLLLALKNDSVSYDRILQFVETSMEHNMDGDDVEVGGMRFQWQAEKHRITVSFQDVSVSRNRQKYVMADTVEADVYPLSLMFGRIRFGDLRVSDVYVNADRDYDGGIDQVAQDAPQGNVRNYATMSNLLYDIPKFDAAHIDGLTVFVHGATIGPIRADAKLKQRFDTRTLYGTAFIPFANKQDSHIRFDFETTGDPVEMGFVGQFDNISTNNLMRFLPEMPQGYDIDLVAKADLSFIINNLWQVDALSFTLSDAKGTVHVPYDNEQLDIEVLGLSGKIAKTGLHSVYQFKDIQFSTIEGIHIGLNGTFDGTNGVEHSKVDIELTVDQVEQQSLGKLWPEEATNNGAHRWLVEKSDGGVFKNINVTARIDNTIKQQGDDVDLPPWLTHIKGTFEYEGVAIDYRAPLDSSQKTKGTGVYDGRSLRLDIQSADIAGLQVRDAVVDLAIIDDTEHGTARINIPLTGDMSNLVSYIMKEPIKASDRVGLDLNNARGQVDVSVGLEFPMDKDVTIEQIDLNVDAQLSDANIPNVVRGLTLAGGPYKLQTDGERIQFSGSGTLGGASAKIDYQETITSDTPADTAITATIDLNDTIRKAFLKDMADYFSDRGRVILDYKAVDNRNADIDLNLDLQNSTISIPSIGYTKSNKRPLELSAKLKLQDDDLKSINNIQLKGQGVSLSKGYLQFANRNNETVLTRGELSALAFDKNKVDVKLNDADGVLDVVITGVEFDAAPMFKGTKDDVVNEELSKTVRPLQIELDVKKLHVSENASLHQAHFEYKSNNHREIQNLYLTAKAGRGDLTVRYDPKNPDANGLTLWVETNDAGDALRIFDLYSNVQGGRLRIAGVPMDDGSFGDVRGRIRIDNFKVNNNPILVSLLNATSLKGLGTQLNFDRLESEFEWRLSSQGDMYVIRNGTTKGASVGLTFDGVVDNARGNLEVKGTIAPLSALNNFIGNIPLIGDILTGGGALLAATYTIDGTAEDPRISVNPLSVLTPGIVRKMLFERSVDMPQ